MTVLESIISGVRADLALRESAVSLDELKEKAARRPAPLSGVRALSATDERKISIIAEVKRSKAHGVPCDPVALATSFAQGGAGAVSVITENYRFGGSLSDLDEVRKNIDIPLLCKDCVVSPYQIWEARAHGADIVLLIAAALEQTVLTSFVERVESLGMTAVVETHDREEARRALDAGARIIGVNARNMRTLEVDMRIFDQVVDILPSSVVRVAASGVRGPQDVLNYARSGANAVLVGEALTTAADPLAAIRELVAMGYHPSLS